MGETYQYKTGLGVKRTVKMFREVPQLSKAEFIENLKAGETYSVKIDDPDVAGTGLPHRNQEPEPLVSDQ